VALVATLGPDTLWELRAAWRAIDAGAHVHRFEEPEALVALARAAGLRLEREARQWHIERHRWAVDVARGLRRLGAHNLDPARHRGLTGKRAWARLDAAYAALGDGGAGVPATWQIIHLVLRKGDG
jgi:malonyl-CoA O-methyltransferase